jgi:hypothetical protein
VHSEAPAAQGAASGNAIGEGIQLKSSKDPKTGEITTTWEVRASGATEVKR